MVQGLSAHLQRDPQRRWIGEPSVDVEYEWYDYFQSLEDEFYKVKDKPMPVKAKSKISIVDATEHWDILYESLHGGQPILYYLGPNAFYLSNIYWANQSAPGSSSYVHVKAMKQELLENNP